MKDKEDRKVDARKHTYTYITEPRANRSYSIMPVSANLSIHHKPAPPRVSMLPAFPPLSLFFTGAWNGAGAFNALTNLHGIKYKFHFLVITCSLQLSSSDSEIVPTPS